MLALWTHAVVDIGSLPAVSVGYFCVILAFWEPSASQLQRGESASATESTARRIEVHVLPAVSCQ